MRQHGELAVGAAGAVLFAAGAGSILGGLIVGRLLNRHGELAIGAAGVVLFAAGALAKCVPVLPVVVGGGIVTGIGLPWTLVAAVTAVQLRTPEELLGRVAASASTLLFAPVALATPLGAAAVLIDRRVPFLIAAAVCVVAGLTIYFRTTRCRTDARTATRTAAQTATAENELASIDADGNVRRATL